MKDSPFSLMLNVLGIASVILGLVLLHWYYVVLGLGAGLIVADIVIDYFTPPPSNPLPSDPFERREQHDRKV